MRSGAFKAAFIYSLLLPITSSPCCCCYCCCCCCCVAFLVLPPLRLGFQWRINEREKHWLSNRKIRQNKWKKNRNVLIEPIQSPGHSQSPWRRPISVRQPRDVTAHPQTPQSNPINNSSQNRSIVDKLSNIQRHFLSLSLSPFLFLYHHFLFFSNGSQCHNEASVGQLI